MSAGDELLNTIVQLSDQMHELAGQGNWEEVVRLETERRDLIAVCFAKDNPFQDNELAARRIRRILDLDRGLMAMGEDHRGELGKTLQKVQRGRNAARAYRRCSR